MNMRRYSLLEAAYQVLRLQQRPMREDEIRAIAIHNGFFRDASSDSLKSEIYKEIRAGGRFVRMKDGFGLREWEYATNPELAALYADDTLERALRARLRALRRVTSRIEPPPAADTLCLWVELCFRFDLKDDARKAFDLILEGDADQWLFARAKRFYRQCQKSSA